MEMTYVWLVLVSLIGAFLQAAVGFGYAVFVMIFFPLILPGIPQAATVCALTSVLISTCMLFDSRKSVQPKKVLWPIGTYFLLMPIALKLVSRIPHREMSIGLGIFLLAIGLYYLSCAEGLRIPCTPMAGMATGAIAGVLGGLFAISGPPAALYCLSVTDSKETYKANLQFFFFLTNIYSVPVRVMSGLVTAATLRWALFSALGLLIGLFAGNIAYRRANLSSIRRWVFLFICAMGAWITASNLL